MPQDHRIVYLNPRDLLPSRQNVRSDPGDLAGLAETIREHGVLQPLGVMREGDAYRVIYGNRRRDAAIVVGLDRVPCILVDQVNEEEAILQQTLENLQRLDLNDMDKSRAFERLLVGIVSRGTPQGEALEAMARTLGLSTRQIQRYLRLRQLPPEVQRIIAQGELGVTHAQHLADLTPATRQEAVALLAVEENLSAAELGRLCAALQHNANVEPRVALEMLRRGERIAVIEAKVEEPIHIWNAPSAKTESEREDEPNRETEAKEEGEEERSGSAVRQPTAASEWEHDNFGPFEPTTRNGNRVRKIHSLDSFMDELQRLTQCLQDGDFQRLIEEDEAASVKVRLAARQARFLADALSAIAQAREVSP